MPGLLQGVALFLIGCAAVYGCIASLKAKSGGETHGHGGNAHH